MLPINRIRLLFVLSILLVLSACDGIAVSYPEAIIPANPNAPIFASGTAINVAENSTTTGYTAMAADADGDTITFSLTAGVDLAAFSINPASGVLSFNTAPNFESPSDGDGNNAYRVNITATDGVNFTTRALIVTVTNTNEFPPVFSSGSAISVGENTTITGYTAAATDNDGSPLTFSLSGGSDQAAFSLNSSTGALSLNTAPDFESPNDSNTDNVYVVEITATDGSFFATQSVELSVTDVNEPPIFTSSTTIDMNENTTVTGFTAAATDVDADTVSFSLSSGTDLAAFNIDSSTGALSFNTAPNFEAPGDSNSDNTYVVEITASDGALLTTQSVAISVTDINDKPVFTGSTAINTTENSTDSGYTATATDEDDGDTTSFSLSGGTDQAAFIIDTDTGLLSFKNPQNFESPGDSNGDNIYVVNVSVSDGTPIVTQTVTITVTNINEPPVFTTSSMAINMNENSTVTGYTATATDPEDDMLTFSLSSGTDQAAFSINSTSGALSFDPAPDFENPSDDNSNGTNNYVVEITATDGALSATQMVTVTVTDVLEVSVSSADIKTIQFGWLAYSGATYYKLLVNPDGISGFDILQDPLMATSTTITLPMHLIDWANARYIVEAYDGTGIMTTSLPVSIAPAMLLSIGYFKANDTTLLRGTGASVDLSDDGSTLAIGSYGWGTGAVHVFSYDGSSWSPQDTLVPEPSGYVAPGFGASLSLSADGNTLAVGADTGNPTAVYLFTRSFIDGTWSQQTYVKSDDADIGAIGYFGEIVSLSSDGATLAVGLNNDPNEAIGISPTGKSTDGSSGWGGYGSVYVFSFDGINLTKQAYIKPSNAENSDYFGDYLSLSADGNTLAVTAQFEDSAFTGISSNGDGEADNSATESGAVYIFSRSGTTWTQQVYVKASNTETNDAFGSAIYLSGDGNTLAVGATGEDSGATGSGGDEADDCNATPELNCAANSGAVYVFSYDGSAWSQQAYIKASNTGPNDYFGSSISLSNDGNILAVSALNERSNTLGIGSDQADNSADPYTGAAYTFSRSGNIWSQQNYIKASNTESGDFFGEIIRLSGDGNTLAVGATGEDSAAIDVGGNEVDDCGATDDNGEPSELNCAPYSGAVYLY